MALLATLLALLLPATASAADSLYWANRDSNTIRVADLADVTGTAANLGTAIHDPDDDPCGMALNPATNKVYWANFDSTTPGTDNTIRVADLDDGSNPTTLVGPTGVSQPCGVAVDPGANKIYWADFGTNTIRSADLDDGGNAGELVPSTGNDMPAGVAIDPAGNKIYWTNEGPGSTIRSADLDDGGNVDTLVDAASSPGGAATNPLGLAVDPAANKLYWTDLGTDSVRFADLDDGGNAGILVPSGVGPTEAGDGPAGVAIDPGANKIYWTAFFGAQVRSANLNDGSGVQILKTGEGANGPNFPSLLKAPLGTALPAISGPVGGELTCGQGDWAPDLLGAFLYRAPASFVYQWIQNGATPVGTDSPTFEPTEAGDYTCTVTATNQAGEASQTSAAFNVPPQTPDVTTALHYQDHSLVPFDGAYPNFEATVGAIVHDSATVGDTTNGTPTGSVEFRKFDNGDCSGTAGAHRDGESERRLRGSDDQLRADHAADDAVVPGVLQRAITPRSGPTQVAPARS